MGVIEAPRGTLIHHYKVTNTTRRCNLIVSTTHNNQAMNEAIRRWRGNTSSRKLTEGLLDHVAHAGPSTPACRAPRMRWARCRWKWNCWNTEGARSYLLTHSSDGIFS